MPLPRFFSRQHAAALAIAALLGSALIALPAEAPADAPVATTLALSGQTTAVFGQPLQVTAKVQPADSSPGPVTGTVTFSVDGAVRQSFYPWLFPGPPPTGASVGHGAASIQLFNLTEGTHQVTAVYSGTSLYQASSSTADWQVDVTADSSAVRVSLLTRSDGALEADAGSVQGAPPGGGLGTGQAQLYIDGGAFGGPQPVYGGGALFPIDLPPGTAHTVTVDYLGSAELLPASQNLYVAPWGSSVVVTTGAGPTSTVVAKATVTSLPAGVGAPDGSVQFSLLDEGTPIGSPVPLVGGVATSEPVVLPSGDAIEADHSGSVTYRASSSTTNSTTTTPSPPAPTEGYWMVAANGTVYGFGGANVMGDAPVPAGQSAVGLAATPAGLGYWIATSRGAVYSFGDAAYQGGNPALASGESVTSISATPDGTGYRLFTNKGRVFNYGSATMARRRWRGTSRAWRSTARSWHRPPLPPARATPRSALMGGIFSFGDATFWGSMASTKLNGPVNGLVPTTDDGGYWLVASDGGVFSFGDATGDFLGSMGGHHPNKPIIGMVAYGNG